MDFPITIADEPGRPLWKGLADALSRAIESGRLAPGEALPSTRELARILQVSRDTVVRSYDELTSRGLILAERGARTIVRPLDQRDGAGLPLAGQVSGRAAWQGLSAYAGRVDSLILARGTSADLPELNFGAAPADLLPSRQWRELVARHCRLESEWKLAADVDPFGFLPLRQAIASYLRRSKSADCEADRIVVFSDSQQGLDLVARLILDPGDRVAVEDPGYCGARETFQSLGATVAPVAVDDNGLVVAELEALSPRPKLIYITPSHHDPTGVVLSMERRRRLLDFARSYGAYIIEDAFDSDYRYGSQPLPAMQSMDRDVPVIYLYSFWKTLFPIATLSCLVLPPALVATVRKAKLLVQRNCPAIEHYALSELLAEGHLERHIRRTRSIYERRRQALIFALTQTFRSRLSCPKESAGLHVLVRLETEGPDEQVVAAARQCGLGLVTTSAYYMNSCRKGEFLVSFATLPEERAEETVEKFGRLVLGRGPWREPTRT